MENVGDVIVFFEFLDQFLDRCALFVGHLFRVERNAFEFTADQFVVVILDVFLDFAVCFEAAIDDDFVLVCEYFVHAAVDQLQFQFVEVDAFDFRNFEDALVIEHEIHGTGGAQRSARLIEITTDIVGSGFDDHGDAERSVAFVDHFLVVGSVFRYGAFDSPLDVLFGHVRRLGILDQHTQTGVSPRVGSGRLDGDLNLLAQLGEGAGHVPPAFQLACFAVFECSSHMVVWFNF